MTIVKFSAFLEEILYLVVGCPGRIVAISWYYQAYYKFNTIVDRFCRSQSRLAVIDRLTGSERWKISDISGNNEHQKKWACKRKKRAKSKPRSSLITDEGMRIAGLASFKLKSSVIITLILKINNPKVK